MVRRGVRADGPAICALTSDLGYPASEGRIEERLASILEHPDHALFVCQLADGSILGWIHVSIARLLLDDRRAEIWGLVVEAGHQRTGIGKSLVRAAEGWAWEQDCRAILVRSKVVREASHAFYLGLGYERIKTQHVYRKPSGSQPHVSQR